VQILIFKQNMIRKNSKLFFPNIIPLLSVLLLVLLLSASNNIDKAGPATAIVSIKLNHSQLSLRMAGVRTSFTAVVEFDET